MTREFRTAFITTINHNVGDDLVREGILFLLRRKIGRIRPMLIHKHFPLTTRDGWEWLHRTGIAGMVDAMTDGRARVLSRFLDAIPIRPESDKILRCDLLVQSGAPVYWCFPDGSGCQNNEWFHPLVERRYLARRDPVPFLNIGAGSCQPYFSTGEEFLSNLQCLDYIRRLHSLSTMTTVRDSLAQRVLASLDARAPLLACPSIFAGDNLEITRRPFEFVALNFMEFGGHYRLNQFIDPSRWVKEFGRFCSAIRRSHDVLLVCHNRKELNDAARLFPHVKRRLVRTAEECLDVYSRARCYIGSRVHGACAVASFGRPAYVIGADSRALMMPEILLSSGFVGDMTSHHLQNSFLDLLRMEKEYAETG
jgi:hypothetical protein